MQNRNANIPSFSRTLAILVILLVMSGGFGAKVMAQIPNGIGPSLVFVESLDEEGKRLKLGTGLVIKNGFIGTNYHYVTGAAEIRVWKAGQPEVAKSNGYLAVDEDLDLILLSVPEIKAPPAPFAPLTFPENGEKVTFFEDPTSQQLKLSEAVIRDSKSIRGESLYQLISANSEGSTGGPVFYQNKVVGFNVAGYMDDRYYAFALSAEKLGPLLRKSFIIKDFNSLRDTSHLDHSHMQAALIESLTSVLWISFEDAVRLAKKDQKKIVVDVYTDWCGWCQIMDRNTYSRKKIIRYINENYYAVRFNAESRDSIFYSGKLFTYVPMLHAHQLAYSLLEGKLSFPSTVFLDEDIKVLTVVQGYQDERKMQVMLHYFFENAYQKGGKTIDEFERELWRREQFE